MPDPVLLAPAAALETIPAYRLVDVLRCLDQQPAAVPEAFSGKVVLVGSNLPEEDRKRTPDRFMPQPTARLAESGECHLSRLGPSHAEGGTTPGVFVHAAAVHSVLTGNLIRPGPLLGRASAAVLPSPGASLLGLAGAPCLPSLWVTARPATGCGLAGP